MNKVTKDNKGFSLVELIVVVLIMGILAVALTPQVLKWVNNSRIANDNALMETLISNCQTSLTNETVYEEVKTAGGMTVTVSGTTLAVAPKTSGKSTSNFEAKLQEYCGYEGDSAWKGKIKTKASSNTITINISEKGVVDGDTTQHIDELVTPTP